MEFFYLSCLWAQYSPKLTQKLINALKKLLNTNLYQAEKNLKKFIFIARGFHNPLIFIKDNT